MSRRRRAGEGPDGLAVIDKPAGWTSHDVVAKARGLLGTRRVGHAGTLDPDVTGVLVLGVGRATRLLRYVTAAHKSYEGTFVLGVETTTLDASGEVVASHEMSGVALTDVENMVDERFTGPILQVPPMVSAVKVGGRRLHELAREGVEVAREPRPVIVYSFMVGRVDDPPGVHGGQRFSLRVECSSGTYIRTLVADLGTALGGGAHLATLRRTSVGSFDAGVALPITELKPETLLDMATAVRDLDQVSVDGELAARIVHGARLARGELGVDGSDRGPWSVIDADGRLLAVYEDHGAGRVKPTVVLAQPDS